MTVQIRPATADDLASVAEIYAHYVRHSGATFDLEPPTVEAWREKHALIAVREGLPFLVAEDGGEVLGYAYAAQYRPKAAYWHTVEDSIYLRPGAGGRGLGRLLLEALVAGVAAAGRREIIAVIADHGDPSSVRLHERFGFRDAGRLHRVGCKNGVWLDTLQMQLSLEEDDAASAA
ncbi:GNAT family N-acetyltransferase [Mangrovactinospora gilvigrisea]|uniref:GNAT family N-acetyltransferase n=1 Tax=Mangrovactinospora gilvigrisea TaxID=1428644 RepID=A0A1J7BER6_9ACTN|nr:GNAT family N-acetyltransferase [Mangrovactinospora gilvigrisea]OIV37134.1 GNAT family N-acetyltransferase [Mangrovactinospora gilvigrisea]